ncbi:MAG: fasciclin domain-containing protein [Acidobacteriota bacterium]
MKSKIYLFIFLVMVSAMVASLQVAAQVAAQRRVQQNFQPTPEQKDLVATAMSAGNFNTFIKAIEVAGLKETLMSDNLYTVFAPTDEAFAKLPAGKLDGLLKNREKLKVVLLQHVVSGTLMTKDATNMKTAPALSGSALTFQVKEGNLLIDDASIVQPDITASNGVIHAIDKVIMPTKK